MTEMDQKTMWREISVDTYVEFELEEKLNAESDDMDPFCGNNTSREKQYTLILFLYLDKVWFSSFVSIN